MPRLQTRSPLKHSIRPFLNPAIKSTILRSGVEKSIKKRSAKKPRDTTALDEAKYRLYAC